MADGEPVFGAVLQLVFYLNTGGDGGSLINKATDLAVQPLAAKLSVGDDILKAFRISNLIDFA